MVVIVYSKHNSGNSFTDGRNTRLSQAQLARLKLQLANTANICYYNVAYNIYCCSGCL